MSILAGAAAIAAAAKASITAATIGEAIVEGAVAEVAGEAVAKLHEKHEAAKAVSEKTAAPQEQHPPAKQ